MRFPFTTEKRGTNHEKRDLASSRLFRSILILLLSTLAAGQASLLEAGNNKPSLRSLSPGSAAAGGSGFIMVATGANFTGGSLVQWNGSQRATTFISSTQLQATISSSDVAKAGTAQVTAYNSGPNGGKSNAMPFTVTPPLKITTTSLPNGDVGVAYSATLSATGGTPPYSWSVASGSLPPGLSLSASGTISGTPTATGSYTFTIRVTDSVGDTASQAYTVSIAPPASITTTSLPNGTVGVGYQSTVSATGGTLPYSWSVASGSLPPGLSLGSTSGTISGTPTTDGSYSFTIQVSDSVGGDASEAFVLSIGTGCAPYCSRTDVATQQISSTPNVGGLTGANTVVTDPDFNNSIVRITDWNTEGSGGPNENFAVDCGGSAEINFMSPDDTKFYLCDGGGGIIPFTFNQTTTQATRMYVSTFPSTNGMRITSNSTSGEWSFTQNNVMYDMEDGTWNAGTPILKYYDFTNQSVPPSPATLFDFSSNPACAPSGVSLSGTIGWAEEPTVSKDDQTFATAVSITGGGQGTAVLVLVWNRTNGCRWYDTQTGAVGGQWGTAGTIGINDRYYIHNARLSKDGNWVKIGFQSCIANCTANIQNYFWQISGTTVETCATSDNCLGHTALGYTHLINSPTTPSQQTQLIRPLNNMANQTQLWTVGPSSFAPWDNHQSWENVNSSDNVPVFSSGTGAGTILGAWDDEIDAFSTDGSGLTYRFAHTFTTDQSQFFSAANAIGSVSSDGKFFAWSSDWMGNLGSTSGASSCTIGSNCRADVFVVGLR